MGDTTQNQGRPASAGAGDILYQAGSDLRATAAEVKSQAGEAASTVRDKAAGVFSDVKAEAAGVADEARERATSFAEQQKHASADQAEGLARAVHRAADELQESSPQLAGYVREAAASVNQLARTVRDRSLGSLVGEVQGMARRQPVAFFGAAVLAGFALSRFVKSSAEEAHQEDRHPSPGGTAASRSSAENGSHRDLVIPPASREQGTSTGSATGLPG